MKKLLLFSLLLLMTSCATHQVVNYQIEKQNTGTLKLIPSKETDNTEIFISGNKVLDKKNILSCTVNNIPAGEYKIQYIANSDFYKEPCVFEQSVIIKENENIVIPLRVPEYNANYYWLTVGTPLMTTLLLIAL